MTLETVDVFGIPVAVAEPGGEQRLTRDAIRHGRRVYVCAASVHLIEAAVASPDVHTALRGAEAVFPDGAPVAWIARRLGGRHVPRLTGSDLFESVCAMSGIRHGFVGGSEPVLAALIARLRARYPEIEIVGAWSPPFRVPSPEEEEELCAAVNDAGPDVVWVGLGAPKQELWMMRNRARLAAPVLAGVGAVFDFASGSKRRAPSFVRAVGLEWAFRLLQEPRRLFGRYVKTNTSFVLRAARAWVAGTR